MTSAPVIKIRVHLLSRNTFAVVLTPPVTAELSHDHCPLINILLLYYGYLSLLSY